MTGGGGVLDVRGRAQHAAPTFTLTKGGASDNSAARRGRGPGKPGRRFPSYHRQCRRSRGVQMTDYRSFVESKLADIDRRREEIETERTRLMTTLAVLDEADASRRRTALTPGTTTTDPAPLPATIVDLLRSSAEMLTANEIHGRLSQAREVPRSHMYSALHRLKKRNMVFKNGKVWGLVGPDAGTSDNSVGHSGSSLLTPPTAH